jgi:hypothetical protein
MSNGFGAGWMGAGWMGAGWFGAGWADPTGGGGGGGGTFATRTDHPLAEIPVPSNFAAKYPDKAWDADLHSLLILPQFFAVANVMTQLENAIPAPPPAPTQAEIDELLILAVTERPEAMGEILNQHQNQQLCFMQLMMMTNTSHPATFTALKYTARIGEAVMIHLKDKFKRARPSQVCPMLYPPAAVPGHASYPAGHAVIAHMTAKCLIDVTTKVNPPVVSPYVDALTKLAERISINRVIAGFHYRSDIAAGAIVADKAYPFLQGCSIYNNTVTAARAEWP